jgi:pimeloyl-ACP methyl ester carboxylesterase
VDDYRRLGGPWGFHLGEVEPLVLVVQGDRDSFVPMRQAEHFALRLPSSRLEVVSGAGHIGVIRDWERVSGWLGWSE